MQEAHENWSSGEHNWHDKIWSGVRGTKRYAALLAFFSLRAGGQGEEGCDCFCPMYILHSFLSPPVCHRLVFMWKVGELHSSGIMCCYTQCLIPSWAKWSFEVLRLDWGFEHKFKIIFFLPKSPHCWSSHFQGCVKALQIIYPKPNNHVTFNSMIGII